MNSPLFKGEDECSEYKQVSVQEEAVKVFISEITGKTVIDEKLEEILEEIPCLENMNRYDSNQKPMRSKYYKDIRDILTRIVATEFLQIESLKKDPLLKACVYSALKRLFHSNKLDQLSGKYSVSAFNMSKCRRLSLFIGVADDGSILGTPLLRKAECISRFGKMIDDQTVIFPGVSKMITKGSIEVRNWTFETTDKNTEEYMRQYAKSGRKFIRDFVRWFKKECWYLEQNRKRVVPLVRFGKESKYKEEMDKFLDKQDIENKSVIKLSIDRHYAEQKGKDAYTKATMDESRDDKMNPLYWINLARNEYQDKRHQEIQRRRTICPLEKWKQDQKIHPGFYIQALDNLQHLWKFYGWSYGVTEIIFDFDVECIPKTIATFNGKGYKRVIKDDHPETVIIF